MNFFPDGNNMMLPPNNMEVTNYFNNNIINKLTEMDNRLRKLEQRIIKLENASNNINYSEPNNSLYMI